VQEAVDALKEEVKNLETRVSDAEKLLTTAADLEKKAGEKLKKKEKEELLAEIGKTHLSIAGITGLKGKVTAVRDSLKIIEDKARGKTKDEIAELYTKINGLFSKIAKFTEANKKLDELKKKLTEKKKEAKKEAKKVKGKKTVAPKKM
jgi:chromosome segregation ATPase